MHATTPPFTKPEAAYDSRRLYAEASAIAAAQDAKLDPGNDALPSILADFRAVVKRLEDYAERLRGKRSNGIPAESAYIARLGPNSLPGAVLTYQDEALREIHASFGPNGGSRASRIISAAERAHLQGRLSPEQCCEFGIGDPHGNLITRRDVAKTATTVATSRHPMAAEALRDHDERLNGPEDHL